MLLKTASKPSESSNFVFKQRDPVDSVFSACRSHFPLPFPALYWSQQAKQIVTFEATPFGEPDPAVRGTPVRGGRHTLRRMAAFLIVVFAAALLISLIAGIPVVGGIVIAVLLMAVMAFLKAPLTKLGLWR